MLELLDELIDDMEARYASLAAAGANDLAEYNARTAQPIPRIVCVCDEYADLLLSDRKRRQEVENRVEAYRAFYQAPAFSGNVGAAGQPGLEPKLHRHQARAGVYLRGPSYWCDR